MPFLQDAGDDVVEGLAEHGIVVALTYGQHLVRDGDLAAEIYLLVRGRLSVTKGEFEAVREAGSVLGEMGVLDGVTRNATVTALEPCDVVVLDPPAFDLLLSVPAAAGLVTTELSKRRAETSGS